MSENIRILDLDRDNAILVQIKHGANHTGILETTGLEPGMLVWITDIAKYEELHHYVIYIDCSDFKGHNNKYIKAATCNTFDPKYKQELYFGDLETPEDVLEVELNDCFEFIREDSISPYRRLPEIT